MVYEFIVFLVLALVAKCLPPQPPHNAANRSCGGTKEDDATGRFVVYRRRRSESLTLKILPRGVVRKTSMA